MRIPVMFPLFLLLACASRTQTAPPAWRGGAGGGSRSRSSLPRQQHQKTVRILLYQALPPSQQQNFQHAWQQGSQARVILNVRTSSQLIADIREGKFELAFLPPLVYAKVRSYVEPILQARMDGGWYSNVLVAVRQEEPFTDVRQIAGKRLLFGPRLSLHSYVWPISQLIYRHVDLNTAAHYTSLNLSDLDLIQSLIDRSADIVFVASTSVGWGKGGGAAFRQQGITFRPFGPPIPTDLVVLRSSLPSETKNMLREQMMNAADNAAQRTFFRQLGWEEWRETDRDTYQIVVDTDNFLSDYLGPSYSAPK